MLALEENITIHLQWHAGTESEPLVGGSVVRIIVRDVKILFEEFVGRGTVAKTKKNTAWGTKEFGFYDLNNNAIFLVEELH